MNVCWRVCVAGEVYLVKRAELLFQVVFSSSSVLLSDIEM